MNIVKKGALCYYGFMIGFFIKKAFFDGWDNLLQIMLLNVIMLGVGFGGFYLAGATAFFIPLSLLIVAAAASLEGALLLTVSSMMARVADYKSFNAKDFFAAFRSNLLHGFLFALVIAIAITVCVVAIPYYLSLVSILGFGLAVLMFWVAVAFALSMQWFLPIRSQLEPKFGKALKKCLIIFFDNPGFSLFMFLYSLVLGALSLVLVFLLPGFGGIVLAQNEAFRLRLYKYDWLESHPELDPLKARKEVPWGELLADDEETVGTRSFRSFIFPWKD